MTLWFSTPRSPLSGLLTDARVILDGDACDHIKLAWLRMSALRITAEVAGASSI